MSIGILLRHKTSYRYDRKIQLGAQTIRLRPAPNCRTPILGYSLSIKPETHYINWQQDPFSNFGARVNFREKTEIFEVVVQLTAKMDVINPFDFFLEECANYYPFEYTFEQKQSLKPYLEKSHYGKLFEKFVKSISRKKRKTVDYLVDLNSILKSEVNYLIRMEPGVQTPEETLEKKCGSCRDSAWLLAEVLRHLGLASRFVSGYLIQLKPDVKSLDGPAGASEDFTDLHAWTEVFLPGAGWVGLDPTSGLFAGEGHIPLACTPKPGHAAPIDGSLEKCEVEFDFEMSVSRVKETPRVTLPYTDEAWSKVLSLGTEIDEELEKQNVHLTMGGEPTFVSVENYDEPEWTSEALGEEKLEKSEQLMNRLFQHYGKGGFLHYGQGKWYPGESLPRWALGCYWRKDEEPIWSNPELLSSYSGTTNVKPEHVDTFIKTLADKLSVKKEKILPAYEDAFYYLWKERRLPVNVDPFDSKLKNKEERDRLSQIFEQGLDNITGYVLPLERATLDEKPIWVSGDWVTRGEKMYLLPGDSPMGLRLPLDSIPWAVKESIPNYSDPAFWEDLPELPPFKDIANQYYKRSEAYSPHKEMPSPWLESWKNFRHQKGPKPSNRILRSASSVHPDTVPGPNQSADWLVRTALCIEHRDKHLNLFMPPVSCTEDYIDLLTAIEKTADQLEIPVRIEGYTPPNDSRIQNFKITPDPGVIEVNIHPSKSWSELVEKTDFLYESARQCKLGTERFDLDGRHTGTGGGNHIIIGGETPLKSPLLRHPQLIPSLIKYWLNHPSLSYLFSGAFVGPTSQAPRVDEARNDALYELEIAFKEIDNFEKEILQKPWLIDRILRNLLIDVTGNTHRAEFCIDKLYPPDSLSQRLGLLEFRAFEMPPHERMSLVQQLLIRGLVSQFWKEPYSNPRLSRWNTQLHDKWMLPHFISRDLEEVCQEMNFWNMNFEYDWFLPHIEFKFPKIGSLQYGDIELELRSAIEPWNVMGEEAANAGTVRYVDSSVERLQIKTKGLNGDRYKVLCHDKIVPLNKTEIEGEYVSGLRYRAWQPPHCLHPTIPVNTPLVFKLYDTWSKKVVKSCAYSVDHPGGLNPSYFPVNAFEAESRRGMRFTTHTSNDALPHDIDAVSSMISPEFPYTLDLRNPNKVIR